MKKLLFAILAIFMSVSASAATELHLYQSPSCPFCHQAMEFFDKSLKKEYPKVKFVYHDVTTKDGGEAMHAAMTKLKIQSNGVPLTVIGDDHIIGYAPQLEAKYRAILDKYEKGIPLPAEFEPQPEAAPQPAPAEQAASAEKSKSDCSKGSFPWSLILGLLTLSGIVFLIVRKK